MKFKSIAVIAMISALSLSGCSSFEGQVGKKTETFDDDYGRACTVVKWGDSASLDCDFPEVNK